MSFNLGKSRKWLSNKFSCSFVRWLNDLVAQLVKASPSGPVELNVPGSSSDQTYNLLSIHYTSYCIRLLRYSVSQ